MQQQHDMTKRAFSEIEASQYIGMSRSFLRQSRMEGRLIGEREKTAHPHRGLSRLGARYDT